MSENDINKKLIMTLRSYSKDAAVSTEFEERLLKHILRDSNQNNLFFNYLSMNKKIVVPVIALTLLAAVVGTGVFIISRNQQLNTSTNLASSLPTEKLNSLNEAQSKLTYKIKIPSIKIKNETLDTIEVGTKNSLLDDSNTLRLAYKDNGKVLYKLTQLTNAGNLPEDSESVTINGVRGIYYYLGGEDYNPDSINIDNALVPRSYVTWKINNVTYEISEFGQLSKEDLQKVAESLKDFK